MNALFCIFQNFYCSYLCLTALYQNWFHIYIGLCSNDCSTANITCSLNKKLMIVIIVMILTIPAALLFLIATKIVLLLITFVNTISAVVQLLLLLLSTRIVFALIIVKTMILFLEMMITVASKISVNGVTIVFVVRMP